MNLLRSSSIRQKITTVIMLITGVVLLIACVALFAFQAWTIKSRMINELAITADIIASNVAVAAMFEDGEKADQILSGLGAMPQIASARLDLNNGTQLAHFGDSAGNEMIQALKPGADILVDGNRVLLSRLVVREKQQQGRLYLLADFSASYYALLKLYGSILALVITGSLVITYFLSGRLQHLVTAPIIRLTATAQQIAEAKDYTVRADKTGTDEVGTLTEAFNQMLTQIQAQDSDLQCAQHELRDQLATLESEIAERKRAQYGMEKLIAINEVTPDFVGRADSSGRTFYINPAGRKLIGLPTDVDVNSMHIRDYHPAWAGDLIRDEALPTAMRDGHWSGETALLRRDGHEIHVSQVIIAHKNSAGEVESFSTVIRDVSERRAAEEALHKSQEQMLKSSRLAGMAEVATSVLHNVGNVLNSVNVSGNVISERLRHSKVETLHKTAGLINEHLANFGDFVTNDSRGQRIPGVISAISQVLREEHAELLAEVDVITSHIGHIKEIVAMQQSYSKVSGMSELVEPKDLIEDALRMNAVSLVRGHIKVVQEIDTVPKVQVDRHKVLQILVNLLTNAEQAVDEMGRNDKQVTLRIQNSGEMFVSISVQDNGVGIAPENLIRIFSHGFTTKKTGHGFGLHSGAIAATEIGGTLRVHSDGPGTGATFTLELPLAT